jgi:hypothetical protein
MFKLKTKKHPSQDELKEKLGYDAKKGLLFRRSGQDQLNDFVNSYLGAIDYQTEYRTANFKAQKYRHARLVWIYHNGDIPDNLVVDHINHIRHDDRIENLQLLSYSDNCKKQKYAHYKERILL